VRGRRALGARERDVQNKSWNAAGCGGELEAAAGARKVLLGLPVSGIVSLWVHSLLRQIQGLN